MSAFIASVERRALDFRIRREEARHWTVGALTQRAAHWMRANFVDCCPEENQPIDTSLIGANALIWKVHSVGFLTEYVGPDANYHI